MSGEGEKSIRIALSTRIDTNNIEVHNILAVWMNYLQSRPDSLYDNPNWIINERRSLREFDLTRGWVFQSADMMQRYQPTVLSIENEGIQRCIRTMFSFVDSGGVAPLAVHRVYAEQRSGQWYLKGAWNVLTQHWSRSQIGKLTFVYANKQNYSSILARKASQWCDSLAKAFELTMSESTVFICESRDELARIIGLDYYVAPPHGITYQENALMFIGLGTPWYPHELVHLIFAQYSGAHPLLREGVATWLGGSLGDTYNSLLQRFVREKLATFHLRSTLQHPVEESESYYIVGAILCNAVYDRGGAEAVRILLSTLPTDEALYIACAQLLGIQTTEVDSYIIAKAKEYALQP